MQTIEELKKIRIAKLNSLKTKGINPYPSKVKPKDSIEKASKTLGINANIAGRIMAIRGHGGSSFMDLADESGKMQLFFSKDKLSTADYELLSLLDIGDFIEVSGKVDKTKSGEITVFVSSLSLLAKSIRPIPPSFYGLKDIETKLRKRYLDLLLNTEIRDLFKQKYLFWQNIRLYLIKEGFMEVETPALEPIPGGADARPFVTHHNALDSDFYLRISLELYQKRLLIGGFEKTFEIGKVFRNEGIDAEHLQDYLQMEFYWAYADFTDLVDFLPKFYTNIVTETFGSTKTEYGKEEIDWAKKWQTIDYIDSFKQETGLDIIKNVKVEDLFKLAEKVGAKPTKKMGEGRLIDAIYKKTIRPKIIKPTLLINHPVVVSPLAKRNEKNPQTVERVQVLAAGTEIGNGWSELNNPIDQKERFEQQAKLRKEGDEEAQMYDHDFVEAMEYGMPPAVGFGLSQRLFAVLVDKPIRETVLFPQLKPQKND